MSLRHYTCKMCWNQEDWTLLVQGWTTSVRFKQQNPAEECLCDPMLPEVSWQHIRVKWMKKHKLAPRLLVTHQPQKGSQWMEKKDINKARLLMLSDLICLWEAHLLIALKLPLISPVKQAFFITHVKSSALPYNMQMVVKPAFLYTARKAK